VIGRDVPLRRSSSPEWNLACGSPVCEHAPAVTRRAPDDAAPAPGLEALVPGLRAARTYRRSWLGQDVVAGLVLTAMLVPQGMAYAELAGLPAVTGLYATLVPLLVYAVFGPSRILVLGPDSALAPIVAAAIVPVAGADADRRVALGGLLALLVGGFLLVGGIARLGFLTDLLSKPVRVGYLAGIVVVVIVQQMPVLLGYRAVGDGFFGEVTGLVTGLPDARPSTALVGIACLVTILALRRLAPRVPGVLVAVAGATLLTVVFGLDVQPIGPVPGGLPPFGLPPPGDVAWGTLTLSALAIALIAFADTSVLSRSYATKLGERVDQNQELRALGLANLATGLFAGFPISSSSSRTPVAETAGARTQLTGVVAAAALGLFLVFGTSLLADIPQTCLAAVVIGAVLRIVDLPTLRRLLAVNRADFAVAVASLAGVAVFGVLPGVGVAVALSVLAVLERAWHPHDAVLGRIDGRKGYHDLERHPEGRWVPGLVLYRFDAPLFFANVDIFRRGVLDAIAGSPAPVGWLVVAAEPVTDVDTTAADVLVELDGELERQGIELAFAELKGPVKDKLVRYGLFDRIGRTRFYPTVGSAVHAYVQETGVAWRDWEEEGGGHSSR
jgi:high affinity sulfate transporter 1